MPVWIKTASWLGGLLTIIALVIALLRNIIELITFLMFAIKAALIVGFIAVIVVIGFLAIRTYQNRRREKNES